MSTEKKELHAQEISVLENFNKGFSIIDARNQKKEQLMEKMNELKPSVDKYKSYAKQVDQINSDNARLENLVKEGIKFYEEVSNVGVGKGDLFYQQEQEAANEN